MKAGTGFFLCVGTGIGILLFSGEKWVWQGLIGAFIISLLHVITKSENFTDFKSNILKQCTHLDDLTAEKVVMVQTPRYIFYSFVTNVFIISVIYGIGIVIKIIL